MRPRPTQACPQSVYGVDGSETSQIQSFPASKQKVGEKLGLEKPGIHFSGEKRLVASGSLMAVFGRRSRSTDAGARRWLEEREFNALYARTARSLAAYIRRMTRGEECFEDILQEAYLRVLRTPVPEMSESQLDAYVYKTASRIIRDRWRHAEVDRRWRQQLGMPPTAAREGSVEPLDVDRILSKLSDRDRGIVWLACVEGRSHAEIGKILGLKTASVRVLLFRARRKLSDLLTTAGLGPEVES